MPNLIWFPMLLPTLLQITRVEILAYAQAKAYPKLWIYYMLLPLIWTVILLDEGVTKLTNAISEGGKNSQQWFADKLARISSTKVAPATATPGASA